MLLTCAGYLYTDINLINQYNYAKPNNAQSNVILHYIKYKNLK